MFNSLKSKVGFTLLELLVIIAIIGVLSTLGVLALAQAREKARDSSRLSDIKTLFKAAKMYVEDNGDAPDPAAATWSGLEGEVVIYLSSSIIPSDRREADGYHYVYCYSGQNYLFAAVMENNQEIDNDIDGAHGYTVASECIFSGGTTDTLDCADIGGAGNVAGMGGSVFCAGYSK